MSPLKTEIANLEKKIQLGEDALHRANLYARRMSMCCAGCGVPGYYDLCSFVDDFRKRRDQLQAKIAYHQQTKKEHKNVRTNEMDLSPRATP